jgi:hypothetical protein
VTDRAADKANGVISLEKVTKRPSHRSGCKPIEPLLISSEGDKPTNRASEKAASFAREGDDAVESVDDKAASSLDRKRQTKRQSAFLSLIVKATNRPREQPTKRLLLFRESY